MTPSLTVAPYVTCVNACDRPSFCEHDQYAANPNNCSSHYRCVFNEWTIQECPSGLHFDAENCVCNFDSIATCQPECPPTTPRPTFQPSKYHVNSPMCNCYSVIYNIFAQW